MFYIKTYASGKSINFVHCNEDKGCTGSVRIYRTFGMLLDLYNYFFLIVLFIMLFLSISSKCSMRSRCSMSSISSMSHSKAIFSYFVWNLGNSEILAQNLCINKKINCFFCSKEKGISQ